MSEPTIAPLGCAPANLQHDVNEAVNLRPDAEASRASVEADDGGAHALHLGLEAVDAMLMTAELATHTSVVALAAELGGPAAALIGYGFMIDHAYTEGDRQNLEINDAMARGAFAALEGRMDDPDVRARARTDTAFADGMMRVAHLANSQPEAFYSLAMTVRASSRGGMLAVARGEEGTPEFRERMQADPAFAHGAGYMERLRDRDPEAFSAKAAWLEGLAADVVHNRQCPVRG
ncbi:MAG: hypothetical protein JRH11_14915 [Deltaproteobacteria bacterium]|nr:hypothetical protein [Deltaproteobacteria bacterium]